MRRKHRPGHLGGGDVEIAKADVEESIELLPIGEPGKIVIRGHNPMEGYLSLPEESAKAVVDAGIQAGAGKIYLCAIKDLWSNGIVGYSIDSRMKASLAVAAARNTIGQRDVDGSILHSDRGSQGGFDWSSQHRLFGATLAAR